MTILNPTVNLLEIIQHHFLSALPFLATISLFLKRILAKFGEHQLFTIERYDFKHKIRGFFYSLFR